MNSVSPRPPLRMAVWTFLNPTRIARRVSYSHLRPHSLRTTATMARAETKPEGTIADAFASLSGEEKKELPPRFAELKKTLLADARAREAVVSSWSRLLEALENVNDEIKRRRQDIIPRIAFNDIHNAPDNSWADPAVKKRGVVIIKELVPADLALGWKSDIRRFCRENPAAKGFPESDPQVWELYWSPSQVAARSHPNMLSVSRRLNSLFTAPPASASPSTALSYADRLRIRRPGDTVFALGPHIDGGSLERWEDPAYRHTYRQILSGSWPAYDPYDLAGRAEANLDLYQGPGTCSALRTFQGWLSMSETGLDQGTLKVYPAIRESTAYLLLRPFFKPGESGGEARWELDLDNVDFPGSVMGRAQEFDGPFGVMHPHLELGETMTSIPKVEPGDAVFWHGDMIHAVESVHRSTSNSSVMYIPAVPLTLINAAYLARQRSAFLAGHPGPDFPGGVGEANFKGRTTEGDVNGVEARRAMGLEPFVAAREEEESLVKVANALLGF